LHGKCTALNLLSLFISHNEITLQPFIVPCCVQVLIGRCQMTLWSPALLILHCACGMLAAGSVYVS